MSASDSASLIDAPAAATLAVLQLKADAITRHSGLALTRAPERRETSSREIARRHRHCRRSPDITRRARNACRRARLRLKPRAAAFTRTSAGTVEKAVTQALKQVGASNVRVARQVLAEVARRLNEL